MSKFRIPFQDGTITATPDELRELMYSIADLLQSETLSTATGVIIDRTMIKAGSYVSIQDIAKLLAGDTAVSPNMSQRAGRLFARLQASTVFGTDFEFVCKLCFEAKRTVSVKRCHHGSNAEQLVSADSLRFNAGRLTRDTCPQLGPVTYGDFVILLNHISPT